MVATTMSPLEALCALVEQLELGNYVDAKGHKVENLQALHDARAVITATNKAIRDSRESAFAAVEKEWAEREALRDRHHKYMNGEWDLDTEVESVLREDRRAKYNKHMKGEL